MPTRSVEKLLTDELGARWRSNFAEFDMHPVAAASIGQVHRGVWHDGRDVAVKLQYPGAGVALLGDFRRLSQVLRVTAGWIPGLDLGPLVREFEGRLAEELDYALEARRQRVFARVFADDESVCAPDVVFQQNTVLVSEWVGGRPLGDVVTNGTPSERDHASDRYLEFLFSGPQLARLLHADPHPGNFRILPDGRLGVMDFGAVAVLPDGLPTAIGQALRYAVEEDAGGVLDVLSREGFVRRGVDVDAEALLDFLRPFTEPIAQDSFTFTRQWMGGQAERLRDPRQEHFGLGLRLNLPPEYLLIHRVWAGGLGVLCQLGGTVPAAEIAYSWLPSLDPEWDVRVASDELIPADERRPRPPPGPLTRTRGPGRPHAHARGGVVCLAQPHHIAADRGLEDVVDGRDILVVKRQAALLRVLHAGDGQTKTVEGQQGGVLGHQSPFHGHRGVRNRPSRTGEGHQVDASTVPLR